MRGLPYSVLPHDFCKSGRTGKIYTSSVAFLTEERGRKILPADAWEPGGGGEAPRGAAEASGNQDHIGGTTLGANLPQIDGFF